MPRRIKSLLRTRLCRGELQGIQIGFAIGFGQFYIGAIVLLARGMPVARSCRSVSALLWASSVRSTRRTWDRIDVAADHSEDAQDYDWQRADRSDQECARVPSVGARTLAS
jgi:hypothetical protein